MARDPCDGCGRSVTVAGGVVNFWSFGGEGSGGLTLELSDGSEHFLCYDCIDRLPDEPTEADVAALPDADERPDERPDEQPDDGRGA